MRAEHQTLVGRDHLAFRSYYYPVKVRQNLLKRKKKRGGGEEEEESDEICVFLVLECFGW